MSACHTPRLSLCAGLHMLSTVWRLRSLVYLLIPETLHATARCHFWASEDMNPLRTTCWKLSRVLQSITHFDRLQLLASLFSMWMLNAQHFPFLDQCGEGQRHKNSCLDLKDVGLCSGSGKLRPSTPQTALTRHLESLQATKKRLVPETDLHSLVRLALPHGHAQRDTAIG